MGSRRIRTNAGFGRGCGQGAQPVAGDEVCQEAHREEAMRCEPSRQVRKFTCWRSHHLVYRKAHLLYTHSQKDWFSQIQSTGLERGTK
eukprot:1511276-Heterocapsa_arctica.AAC.1